MDNPCQTAGCARPAMTHGNFCILCRQRLYVSNNTMYREYLKASAGLTSGEQENLLEAVVHYMDTFLLDQIVFRCSDIPDETGGEG